LDERADGDCQKTLFLKGSIPRALLSLAVPIILANLLQTGYQLTDAFWVGRPGAAAVAAISVSFPVTFLVIALGSGLAMAGATMTAQYVGAGRQDMVNHVAAQTMLMVMITSVIFGALGFTLAPALFHLLGVAPDVYQGALGFLCVSFVRIIFVFVYAMFQALMRGVGQTRTPLMMIQFPLAYILAKHTTLHADGLWWSSPVTNVAVALISVAWCARGSWKTVRLTEDDKQVAEVTREAVIEEGIH
jgi:Na+-driven multidrug efflux pump